MAKAANEIPTPKPIYKESEREQTKPPESAPANKPTENAQTTQVVPFTPHTQEMTTLTKSLSTLVTSFKRVME